MNSRRAASLAVSALLGGLGLSVLAQEQGSGDELRVLHAECSLFGPQGEKARQAGLNFEYRKRNLTSALTTDVVSKLGRSNASSHNEVIPGGSRTDIFQNLDQLGTIDSHLFRAMMQAGITPAERTGDYEYIRRVTLDLTGRVPTYERLQAFINDGDPNKRAKLVDELLARPEWVDRWGMYFGDLFKNNQRNTQILRSGEGRNAFYAWIRESLSRNKPYNQIATELITATGGNSFEQGELNWLVGGFVTGSPRGGQDIFDQQAANVAETFLGLSHENCILCHDGRRHLDTLSVWGKQETRLEAWQLAAFFAKTSVTRVRYGDGGNDYYWAVADNSRLPDYPLNTTTGNRPERQPIGSIANVRPVYPFSGESPAGSENYRAALARFLTKDIQFSRAIVNYLWKEFFSRGIVEPTNQFDLMRLDPANPPSEPWTIQPSNSALLDALAQDFQNGGYDLKAFMRQIVLSEAYQLSSRYNGNWKPEYETYFARKYVRRLWGEEVVDALAQVSNLPNRFNVRLLGVINWAMQLPEPFGLPGEPYTSFMDSFLRGNRDDEERRSDGSVTQALNLMNDSVVVIPRSRASGTGAAASYTRQLLIKYPQATNNSALINEMFLTVLSRPATEAEMSAASANLGGLTGTPRQQKVEDLLWALYNKVDFFFNY